jgi:prophage antirepressor-like protein
VWTFGDKAIRVDDSGPEPMFCLKDCLEANGLNSKGGARAAAMLQKQKGVTSFVTPGGSQRLVTISEEGFYNLTMRGNKPLSEAFRQSMARVSKQLRKTGQATMADAVGQPAPPQSAMDVLRKAMLAQQQQVAINLQLFDQIAAQERQIAEARSAADEANARIDAIEERQEAATAELLSLPAPTVSAPPQTTRQRLMTLVRTYCIRSGVSFRDAFGELYRQIRDRLHIDLSALTRNRPKKEKLGLLEESGRIEEAYAIACELFLPQLRVAE